MKTLAQMFKTALKQMKYGPVPSSQVDQKHETDASQKVNTPKIENMGGSKEFKMPRMPGTK